MRWVAVRSDGLIDLADFERALSEGEVRLVAVQSVNSETGVIQPVTEVIAAARRPPGARVPRRCRTVVRAPRRARGRSRHTQPCRSQVPRGQVDRGVDWAARGSPRRPCSSAGARSAAHVPERPIRSPPRGSRPRLITPSKVTQPLAEALRPMRDALEGGAESAWCPALAPMARAAAPRMPHVSNIAFPG